MTAGSMTAKIAKTMDAAPLIPDHDTIKLWRTLALSGVSIANTATGRATNVRNNAISRPTSATLGSCEGNANKPSIKNNSICMSPVVESKKLTSTDLLGIRRLPRIIPVM